MDLFLLSHTIRVERSDSSPGKKSEDTSEPKWRRDAVPVLSAVPHDPPPLFSEKLFTLLSRPVSSQR